MWLIIRTYRSLIAAVTLSLVLLYLSLEWYGFHYVPAPNTQVTEVYFPIGSSINSIANTLHSQGVLQRPRAFIFMARLQNLTHSLKAGEYIIPTNITPAKLLQLLAAGKVRYREITFVEGLNFSQILDSLEKNSYLHHDLQGKTPQEIMAIIGKPEQNPEGRFYPDTFIFARDSNESLILKQSYQLMNKHLEQLWQQRAMNAPYHSVDEAVIVASLIEKETAVAAERPQVAGVILRRLQKRMLLQIDPTVIYALGQQYQGRLIKEDLKFNSPYNTYLYHGLPPTPIAMPGLSSIEAALHPAEGDTLYYVSKGDGSHEFSATLAAHNTAVKKLRQLQGRK